MKPCPFCNTGDECPPYVDDGNFVVCRYCGARATHDRWNNRPTERAARVAGIREAADRLPSYYYEGAKATLEALADSIEGGEG